MNKLKPANSANVELDTLVSIFYPDLGPLGKFREVSGDEMPTHPRQLLAHNHHMTVSVEEYHHTPVDVKVLLTDGANDTYSRKIELTRQSDGRVVQFGIVRLDLTVLEDQVRSEIESQTIPLGRALINHNVLREVKLQHLYRIEAGEVLAHSFGIEPGQEVFGRTAMIWCNGSPAIELLEIVGNYEKTE